MNTSTRLAPRYRDHLKALRTLAYKLESEAECNAFIDALEALGGDLAMGFPPTVEVELSAAPGDQVVLDAPGEGRAA